MTALPQAPDDRELYAYVDPKRSVVWSVQVLSSLVLGWSLLRFAAMSSWARLAGAAALLAVIWSLVSSLLALRSRRFDTVDHLGRVRTHRSRSSVDVFLPTCGEDLDVLANTFHHLSGLRWDGPLEVYVLDDSGRGSVAALAKQHGFTYLSRPDRGVMKKAGNLRYGFARSSGEFIVVFDADFCPRSDFLLHTMPYTDDPSVGIVQTPQYFDVTDQQGWLERGAGAVQEYFYRWVQPVRNRWRGAICVGSCGLYRRSALEPMGGTALIEHSEDVHTGFDLLTEGYRVEYLPLVLAKGLCPDRIGPFLNQQYRWCAGSMSLMVAEKFRTAPVGIMPRVCFATGFAYYIVTGLMVLLLPLPALVMVWGFPEFVAWQSWVPLLPGLVLTFVIMPAWHRCSYGFDAWCTKLTYGWAHLWALRDRMRGHVAEWRPTGAVSGADREKTFRRVVPAWTTAWVLALVAGVVVRSPGESIIDLLPLVVFAVIQVAIAAGSLRDPAPQAVRQAAKVPVLVGLTHRQLAGLLARARQSEMVRHSSGPALAAEKSDRSPH